MGEWIPGGYDGLFYLGEEGTDTYRGYVVQTTDDGVPEVWFAYAFNSGTHEWLAEGSREDVMRALEGVSE